QRGTLSSLLLPRCNACFSVRRLRVVLGDSEPICRISNILLRLWSPASRKRPGGLVAGSEQGASRGYVPSFFARNSRCWTPMCRREPRLSGGLRKSGAKPLSMDQIGVRDEYEGLGGDSLLAAAIFAEIEQTFSIEIPMATLVDALTIEQVAPRI